MFNHVRTIDDCIKAAEELKREAKMVSSREEHAKFWDKKVELLHIVNNTLETGYWVGSLYDKLWMAKHTISQAEKVAGEQALKTYVK